MKNRIGIGLIVLLVAGIAAVSYGAPAARKAWASGGTDVGNTLCYAVASAHSENGGEPIVTYLNATSDKAASVVQFYNASSPIVATATNSTTTIYTAGGVGTLTTNDICIIQHKANDTYERRIIASITTTNIVTTVAPTAAVIPGDVIWEATATGTIPVGAATKELDGGGIYAGERGEPLLIEVDGTSACQLNAVSGTYAD